MVTTYFIIGTCFNTETVFQDRLSTALSLQIGSDWILLLSIINNSLHYGLLLCLLRQNKSQSPVLSRIRMTPQPWFPSSQEVNWLLIPDCWKTHVPKLFSSWQMAHFWLPPPFFISAIWPAALQPWPRVPPWGQVGVLHQGRSYKYGILYLSAFYFL